MWRLLLGTMGVKSLVQGLNAVATAGFEPRTVWSKVRRRNRKMESIFNLCQQVHLWLGTGLCVVSSMLGETRATEKRLPTLQGSWQMRARVPGIAERKAPETRCSLLADSQTQNKPVVLSRHQGEEREIQREKRAATLEGKIKAKRSCSSFSPPSSVNWLCRDRNNRLSNRDFPRDEPRQ